MMNFKEKIVLVTGAGSGIGRATAIRYAQEGATVIVSDVNVDGSHETIQTIEAAGGKATFIKANVADKAEVDAMFNQIKSEFGQLDVLVNNAGIGGTFSMIEDTDNSMMEKIFQVNVFGVWNCLKGALPIMKAQNKGAIVNVASMAGLMAAMYMGAYGASKHAVVGLTKTAALEYARYNIKVNAVCPTVIKTPMGDSFTSVDGKVEAQLKRSIPMRRFGEAKEVAAAIVWLSSEDCSFTTGHCMPIDGGSAVS